ASQALYLADGAEGTSRLGSTLTSSGDPADAHFVNLKSVKDFGQSQNLAKFIEDQGGEKEAKEALKSSGFDGLRYTGEDGKPAVVAFDDKSIRPAEELKNAADKMWNKNFVYVATDAKNADVIRNAGIKNLKQRAVDTPEEAISSAPAPV